MTILKFISKQYIKYHMLNPLGFISRFIKSSNQRELDRMGKIVNKINLLEETV